MVSEFAGSNFIFHSMQLVQNRFPFFSFLQNHTHFSTTVFRRGSFSKEIRNLFNQCSTANRPIIAVKCKFDFARISCATHAEVFFAPPNGERTTARFRRPISGVCEGSDLIEQAFFDKKCHRFHLIRSPRVARGNFHRAETLPRVPLFFFLSLHTQSL